MEVRVGDKFKGLHPADAIWNYEVVEIKDGFARCVATAVKPDSRYPKNHYYNTHDLRIDLGLFEQGTWYEKIN